MQFIEEKIMERAVLVKNTGLSRSNDDLDRIVSAGVRQINTKSLTKRFRNAMEKGVAGIIEAGRVLIEAKKRLPRGQFTDWVVDELRFGSRKERSREADIRKAEMLMLLARNDVISNSCHWHALPPSPYAL